MEKGKSLLFYVHAALMAAVFVFIGVTADLAQAKDKVATLKNVTGTVQVKHSGGGWQSAGNGTELYEQDMVRTKLSSECQIVFSAGHNVKVNAMSTIQVKAPRKANKNDKEKNPTSDVKVKFGKVFAKVKKSTGGNTTKFEVSTPTSVAGIRGTMLAEDVEPPAGQVTGDTPPEDSPANVTCTTSVAEGTVVVSNDAGNEVTVNEGQEVSADPTGDMPDNAQPMSEQSKGDWEANKDWVQQVQTEVEGTPPTTPAPAPTTETPVPTPTTPAPAPTTETPTAPAPTETPTTTETAPAPTTETAPPPAETETTEAETAATTAVNEAINSVTQDSEHLNNLEEFSQFGTTFTPEQQDVSNALQAAADAGTLDNLLAAGVDITNMDANLINTLSDLAASGNLDAVVSSGVDLSQVTNVNELTTAVQEAGGSTAIINTIQSAETGGAETAVNSNTSSNDIGTTDDLFTVPETPDDILNQQDNTKDISVDEETFTQ